MRVIFMGTPDFSVGTLEALIAAGHDVCLAVTQPDKPKGRGGKMQYTPVKEKALFYNIPVYQPKRVRDPECVEELQKYNSAVLGYHRMPVGVQTPWTLFRCRRSRLFYFYYENRFLYFQNGTTGIYPNTHNLPTQQSWMVIWGKSLLVYSFSQ